MANMNWGYDEQGNRRGVPVPQLKDTSWGYDPQGVRKPNPVNQDAQEAMREGRMAQINNEYSSQPGGLSTDGQEDLRDNRMRDIGLMGAYDNRDPRQTAWAANARVPAQPQPQPQPQPTDPWKAMAQQLAQYSAQRAAPQFAQQEQTPGFNALPDRNAEENAEKTRRWAMQDIASMRDPRQAALMAQMFQHDQGDQTQRRGQDIQEGVSGRGQNIQARGQDIQAGVSTRGQDVQARGQEMGLAGQFINQVGTGLNQQAHDERSAKMQKELEELKQKDPKTHAMVEYYLGNARESDAKTKLYGVQTDAYKNEMEMGKGPAGMYNKRLEAAAKIAQSDPDSAKLLMKQATDDYHRAMFELEKKNGKQGYADGGQVESAEQLLARMKAKYGGAPSPQTEQPAPTAQPRPQAPAPQQPKTWSEKMRDVATGGLERRMQGYAVGGPVNTGDDSQAGLNARLAAMQAGNMEGGGFSATAGMNNAAQNTALTAAQGGPKQPDFMSQFSTALASVMNPKTDTLAPAATKPGEYGYGQAGFAQGGPIDVSGRQVLGAGTGKSDSLPAIIDGEHPAALSTDEFVMPVETVRHFGLAKLNKMVEQSRKGLDTGRKPA